jgi:bilin biosynthesis protein
MVANWGAEKAKVESYCEATIFNRRPQFSKSRPAAILALLHLQPERLNAPLAQLLDPAVESNWECRYASWMAVAQMITMGLSIGTQLVHLHIKTNDPNAFVESKKRQVAGLLADF